MNYNEFYTVMEFFIFIRLIIIFIELKINIVEIGLLFSFILYIRFFMEVVFYLRMLDFGFLMGLIFQIIIRVI